MKLVNSRSILAIIVGTICTPAFAGLQGADKNAADAYFAAHPEIAKYAPWVVSNTYDAANLEQANNQLSGNIPWNSDTNSYLHLDPIAPVTNEGSVTPTATPTQAELRAKFAALKAQQIAHGEELTAANVARTASQHVDPAAARAAATTHENTQDAATAAAQSTADTALHNANWASTKADDAHHAIMSNQIDIDKNSADIATNTTAIKQAQSTADTAQASASHANINANAALKTVFAHSAVIVQNRKDIAANKVALSNKVDASQYANDKVRQLSVDTDQDKSIEQNRESVNTAQASIEGIQKQEAIQNGSRVQGMIAAKHNAELAASQQSIAALKADVDGLALQEANRARTAPQHAQPTTQANPSSVQIAANSKATQQTAANVKTLARNQQVTSARHGAQIQTLAVNQNTEQQEIIFNHSAVRSVQSQADSNTQQINKLNSNFSNLKSEVNDNKKQASAGISGAMAQANIPQVLQGQSFAVGAGVGGYDGENAVAVGVSFRATQSVTVKATVSDDTEQNVGYGAGVSVGW